MLALTFRTLGKVRFESGNAKAHLRNNKRPLLQFRHTQSTSSSELLCEKRDRLHSVSILYEMDSLRVEDSRILEDHRKDQTWQGPRC
jgi:hypothetical protein